MGLSSSGVHFSRVLAALCNQWLLLPPIVSQVELPEWLHAQAKNSADPRVLASVSCTLASFLSGAWKKPGKGCVLQNRLKCVIGDYAAYK